MLFMNNKKQVFQYTLLFISYLLIISIAATSMSQSSFNIYDVFEKSPGYFNDARVGESINRIIAYLEGSFGALIMVSAGILAIISAAFGNYRASIGLLIVAIGPFILRSLVGTFFNDQNIR